MITFKSRRGELPAAQFKMPRRALVTDRIDLRELALALMRRRWTLGGATVLMAALFYIISVQITPTFSARATVMLDPREQQVSGVEPGADVRLNTPLMDSEVAVIQSNQLLWATIQSVGLDRVEAVMRAEHAPSAMARLINAGETVARTVLRRPAQTQASPETRLHRVTAAVRRALVVRRVGQSYVIEIMARTQDAALSQALANTLAQAYIHRQMDRRRDMAQRSTKWLSDQVGSQKTMLSQAESQVESFKARQIVGDGMSSEVMAQQMVELNDRLAQVQADVGTAEARVDQIDVVRSQQGEQAVADLLSSPMMQSLRDRHAILAQQDAVLAATLGSNHPLRRELALARGEVSATLARQVDAAVLGYRNDLQMLKIREGSLMYRVQGLETRLSDMSRGLLELRQLEREADALRITYENWLGRLAETRAQVELQQAEAVLLNSADLPAVPFAPRPKLMTGFGAVLGLILGLCLAVTIETTSRGFVRAAQIEESTGLPVLVSLPKGGGATPEATLDQVLAAPNAIYPERLRQLRETLLLTKTPGQPRSYLMSSSVPGEGKTTTALALARMFALSGRSTLLVDLDTRRSEMSRIAERDMDCDLIDYLNGDVELEAAVQRSDRLGFDLLCSRAQRGTMADDLQRSDLKGVLDTLKQSYEIVVIDAPPLLAVSDALLLASVVDSLLFVVRARSTPKKAVEAALAHLAGVGVTPQGMVFNAVASDQASAEYVKGYSYGLAA
ncbi:MAG: GumC family protein [Sedimentitalea sp.]